MLHTLFTQEHNYICDLLAHEHPDWNDDQLFARARLINSALMAKIHTVEWTPAIVPHPIIKRAMNVELVAVSPARSCRTRSSSSTTRSCSAASSARTPITTARRTR